MVLTINREAALASITKKVESGLDRALNDMTAHALKLAPVRKDKARTPRKREDAVRAVRENFVTDNTRFTFFNSNTPRTGKQLPAKTINLTRFHQERHAGATVEEAEKLSTISRTGSFTFKFQNTRTHETTNNIGFDAHRGRLTQKAVVRGGYLKSKIRRTAIEIDGTRLTGKLVSGAPYSMFVEGTKRGRGAPQPYMRPAIAEYKANWRTYFSGKK